MRDSPILRDRGRWGVSSAEIPANLTHYPPYCLGALYLASPATARRLARAATTQHFFRLEDAWVTGLLAKAEGLTHTQLFPGWTEFPARLLLHKAVQSPAAYQPDLLGGAVGNNRNLSLALASKAEWCWRNSCYNNIYHIPPTEPDQLYISQAIQKNFGKIT